jgi:hypothetical protein
MLTIELCPSPVFGPSRMRRFGKPGTVVAACTRGLPSHTSASVRPSRPWTTGRSASRRRGSQCRTRVDLELAPAGGDDRALTELADALGDQLDVVAAERRYQSWRQDALAADRQARGRLRDQLGVASERSKCLRPTFSSRIPFGCSTKAEHHQLAGRLPLRAKGSSDRDTTASAADRRLGHSQGRPRHFLAGRQRMEDEDGLRALASRRVNQKRFTAGLSAARRTSRSHSAKRAGRTRKALPRAGDSVPNRGSSPDPNGPRDEQLRPRFDR